MMFDAVCGSHMSHLESTDMMHVDMMQKVIHTMFLLVVKRFALHAAHEAMMIVKFGHTWSRAAL